MTIKSFGVNINACEWMTMWFGCLYNDTLKVYSYGKPLTYPNVGRYLCDQYWHSNPWLFNFVFEAQKWLDKPLALPSQAQW